MGGRALLRPGILGGHRARWKSRPRSQCLRTAKLDLGIYEVFFTGDVSNGAFVATIGRPGIATEPPGEITVALRCCPGTNPWTPFADNKGVWVQTFDSNGVPSDRSFHLIVLSQDM